VLQDQFGCPLEESRQVQTANDHHHREQEHDGREVDNPQCPLRGHDSECHHGYCAHDRRRRAVDFEARKLAQREHKIARAKNDVGGKNADVRKQLRGDLHDRSETQFIVPKPRSALPGLCSETIFLQFANREEDWGDGFLTTPPARGFLFSGDRTPLNRLGIWERLV